MACEYMAAKRIHTGASSKGSRIRVGAVRRPRVCRQVRLLHRMLPECLHRHCMACSMSSGLHVCCLPAVMHSEDRLSSGLPPAALCANALSLPHLHMQTPHHHGITGSSMRLWRAACRAYDMAAIKVKGIDNAVTNFDKVCYADEPFMQVRGGP